MKGGGGRQLASPVPQIPRIVKPQTGQTLLKAVADAAGATAGLPSRGPPAGTGGGADRGTQLDEQDATGVAVGVLGAVAGDAARARGGYLGWPPPAARTTAIEGAAVCLKVPLPRMPPVRSPEMTNRRGTPRAG
jgi:hypothetical protein